MRAYISIAKVMGCILFGQRSLLQDGESISTNQSNHIEQSSALSDGNMSPFDVESFDNVAFFCLEKVLLTNIVISDLCINYCQAFCVSTLQSVTRLMITINRPDFQYFRRRLNSKMFYVALPSPSLSITFGS